MYIVSCSWVYPASKSSMTIRHCYQCTDIVSILSVYIFLNAPIPLGNLVILSILQVFPSSFPMSPWILCFFCCPTIKAILYILSFSRILMLHFYMLVTGYFLTSIVCGLVLCVKYVFCSVWPCIVYNCCG